MGGMCSGLGGKDGLELRIEKALQEIIKHKNARAAAIKAGEKPEGGDGQFQFDAGDDIQASFNRIILKFPVLRRAISGIRQVFRTFDTDNSGTIDKKELGKCLAALGAVMTEQEVNHMFKYANFSHKGSLSFKEFVLCLCLGSVLQLFPLLKAYTGVTLRQESSVGNGLSTQSSQQQPANTPTTQLHTTPILVQPAGTGANGDAPSSPAASASAAAPSGNSTPSSTTAHNNPSTPASQSQSNTAAEQPAIQPDAALLAQGRRLVKALRIILEAYVLFDKDGSGAIDKNEVLEMIDAEQKKRHNHAPPSAAHMSHSGGNSGNNLHSNSGGGGPNADSQQQAASSVTSGARDSIASVAGSTARIDTARSGISEVGAGASATTNATSASVATTAPAAPGTAPSAPVTPSASASVSVVPSISIPHPHPFSGNSTSSLGLGGGTSSGRKTRGEASGNVLLSKERWLELDHDKSGQISFAEFVFAFMDWVGIEDDDEDEDDVAGGASGANGAASGAASLLAFHNSSLAQASTRYSSHNTEDASAAVIAGSSAGPAGGSSSVGTVAAVLAGSSSAHGLSVASNNNVGGTGRRHSRGQPSPGQSLNRANFDAITGSEGQQQAPNVPPIHAPGQTTANSARAGGAADSTAAAAADSVLASARAPGGGKPATHGILKTSRPGSASVAAAAAERASAAESSSSGGGGSASSRRNSLKANSMHVVGHHESTAAAGGGGGSPTSGGTGVAQGSSSLRGVSLPVAAMLALSSDVESGFVPPAIAEEDIDAQLELPRRSSISAAEKAQRLQAQAEAANSEATPRPDSAAHKAALIAQSAAFETAIKVHAAGVPTQAVASTLRTLSAMHHQQQQQNAAATASGASTGGGGAEAGAGDAAHTQPQQPPNPSASHASHPPVEARPSN